MLKNHVRSMSSQHGRVDGRHDGQYNKFQNGCEGEVVERLDRLRQEGGRQIVRVGTGMPVDVGVTIATSQQINSKSKAFQFYDEPYEPKHYIVSPKGNMISPTLFKLVSPISNSSISFNNHNQMPFSLRSPHNIIEGEKMVGFN